MSNYKLIYRISVIVIAVLSALIVGAAVIMAVGGDVFGTYWIIISMPFRNFRTLGIANMNNNLMGFGVVNRWITSNV